MSTAQAGTSLLVVSAVAVMMAAPAFGQYHLCWGDMHGHTSISDGKGDLDAFLTYARDVAKLDFVIVTDHDFGNAHPWWMPKEAWVRTQERVDAYTVPGKFVAIVGYEWTSQEKYWSDVGPGVWSERLFAGPPKNYNHKTVYFPSPVEYLFCAKDPAYHTPDGLAEAVRATGGLINNAHPGGDKARDQFDYAPGCSSVIVNTEMGADTMRYGEKTYELWTERVVRSFLNRGGKTGFVSGTDTHEGKPSARTGVWTKELTRPALFEALRQRRNYAVSNAKIILDFTVNRHHMGEEIATGGNPRLAANVAGTAAIEEVAIIRDGVVLFSLHPGGKTASFTYVDDTFGGSSYYYLRVTQVDKDAYGNPSRAWSSPIWVTRRTPHVRRG